MKFTVEMFDGLYLIKPMTVQETMAVKGLEIVGKEKLDPDNKIGCIIQAPAEGLIDTKLTTDPLKPVRWPLRFKRGDIVGYDRAASINLPIRDGKMLVVPDNAVMMKFHVETGPELVDPWGKPL